MKIIENWEELKKCTSETHKLNVDLEFGCGRIVEDGDTVHYLSTHTFYESTYKQSEEILNQYGFNVKLVSWG